MQSLQAWHLRPKAEERKNILRLRRRMPRLKALHDTFARVFEVIIG